MKKNLLTFVLCVASMFQVLMAQNVSSPFRQINEENIIKKPLERRIIPTVYKTYSIDEKVLKGILATAPIRQFSEEDNSQVFINIPMPDGTVQAFAIYNDPVSAGREENINTYYATSLTERGTTARLDFTLFGFHAMVLSAYSDAVYIDPYYNGDAKYYTVYYKKDYPTPSKIFKCGVGDDVKDTGTAIHNQVKSRAGDCGILRKYRLALGCSVEYSDYHGTVGGPTLAKTRSAMTTTINRVNLVYEKELSVRFEIIDSIINKKIIYGRFPSGPTYIVHDTLSDPFTNYLPSAMLNQLQNVCDTHIGVANYDLGHVFGTGGGGFGNTGPCRVGKKARGVTAKDEPKNDPFDIDYVCHELGHQLSAPHTFASANPADGCTVGNNDAMNSIEPGSGSTIMGYAGICTYNVQGNTDDYFQGISLSTIKTYIQDEIPTCGTTMAIANAQPTATAGASYFIPVSTPFTLKGTSTDANAGDVLTHCWEQFNIKNSTGIPTPTTVDEPVFRSLKPTVSKDRTFPRLDSIVANITPKWEVLPSVARVLKFRFTVRDNKGAGGCTAEDSLTITTVAGGPFVVTFPSVSGITLPGLSMQTITWNKSNTNVAPINAPFVKVFLSTDGGLTYPTLIAANVPNTGSALLTIPNMPTTTARIRIEGQNNVFFDISDFNFTITAALPVRFISFNAVANKVDIAVKWETATEINNAGFEVQRSENFNSNFVKIAFVNPATSNTLSKKYEYIDRDVVAGKTYYYRLKQLDTDGREDFTVVKAANLNKNGMWDIALTPNPTKDFFSLNVFSDSKINKQIEIIATDGRLIKRYETLENELTIDVEALPEGIYFIKVTSEGQQITKKFLKK